MNHTWQTIRQIIATKSLRDKLLFTLFMLLVFRIAAHITIPGVDVNVVNSALESPQSTGIELFSLLTGGAMERFSIVLMGLTPYINASIMMQLLTVIVPSLENLKKEGEQGQKKISQYTRLLTVPIAFLQSYGMLLLLNRLINTGGTPIIAETGFMAMLPLMIIVTAGTVGLMWLGELITEKGIGNGISIIIFAGIVSVVPGQIASSFSSQELPVALMLGAATVALTLFVVYVMEADRRVPVIYASRKGGQQKSFLPLKIAQAGMIPIIFAISVMSFPSILSQFWVNSANPTLAAISDFISLNMNPNSPTWGYNLFYAALIFGFTFFYITIIFEPKKIAENIQSRGGYVPGYRPGTETEQYLGSIMMRLSFWGGSFLAFVAIAPLVFQNWIGTGQSASLFISGAGIIIVVSVVLDLIRRINAQLVMHDYDKL